MHSCIDTVVTTAAKALLAMLFTLISGTGFSQGFIAASTFLGGSGSEQEPCFVVDNGFTYVVGQTNAFTLPNTFPVTVGGGAASQWDLAVTKLDANGDVVWSRFLGGNNTDFCSRLAVTNGSLLIVGNTRSTDFTVTDGSSYSGTGNNGFYTRLDATTGSVQFSTIYGQGSAYEIDVAGGHIYIAGHQRVNPVKGMDLMLVKYDAATNALIYRENYGGTASEEYQYQMTGKNFKVVGNSVYMTFNSTSVDFPVTDGSTRGYNYSLMYGKMDAVSGSLLFARYLPGNSDGAVMDLRVDNGGVFIFGQTASTNIPVTDGSVLGSVMNPAFDADLYDAFILKLDASTNKLLFGKYIGGNEPDYPVNMEVQNGTVYLFTYTNSFTGFPITTGSTLAQGGSDIAITKLNATTGDITFSSFITASSSAEYGVQMQVVNGEVYITGITYSSNYPVTNGSVRLGGAGADETFLTKIGVNNTICFSTYLGHSSTEYPVGLVVSGDSVYLVGCTSSASFPVTNNRSRSASFDFFWTKFNLNPTISIAPHNIIPATQTTCRSGTAATLTASAAVLASSNMPLLYRSGVPTSQNAIEMRYQWQVSSAATGPWTNIPGAIDVNYSPQAGLVNQYYRRNTFASSCATGAILSTSGVAEVLVNGNTAPVVNAGNVINTCSAIPVTLGGATTAVGQGGASIVSYSWTPSTVTFAPSASVANPTVSVTSNTIVTVRVTDDNGCVQIAQALVNKYAANAGADVGSCNGTPVRIGGAPIAGLPGVVYAWSSVAGDPVTKLSCTNCAQPSVENLTQVTTYRLTLTVPVTGGGTCTTTDDVLVRPVAGPVSSFGAPDVIICGGGSASIGRPAEAGFTYTWSPGNYLAVNNTTPTTFQPGSFEQFSPNPFTYYLTANKNGCVFVDSVKAYMLKADAGLDKCGPAQIGAPNPMPNINATFNWTKITMGAGTSNFSGATNVPIVSVTACTVPTVFQLDVTFNGVTCSDQVTVDACGCSLPDIKINAPNGCASYVLNQQAVSLTASTFSPATFTWTTTGGVTLSAYSGATVSITNGVPGSVTVIATNALDASISCSKTIDVNSAAWSLPAFKALDTTVCPSTPIAIGQPPVAGYSYVWSGLTSSLSPNNQEANPIATVNSTTSFTVLVTDVGSGCIYKDTATIIVQDFPAGIAGRPVNFCGVSTSVQLGVPALPNTTYTWTPATSYAPNNTAANPTVTVATTTSFYVTAINSVTGCSKTDSVRISVNPAVPPFSFADQFYCPSTLGTMPLPAGPTGMASYQWSPAALVLNASSNGPTATTTFFPPQQTTNFTLKVTNANGCTADGSVRFVPNTPSVDAGPNRTICRNTTTQLGGAPEAGATYVWSGTAVAALSATNIPNPIFTPTANGSFTFSVSKTSMASLCTSSAQVMVTVVDYSIPPMISPTVCENTCVQIGTFSQSGVQYFWTPATGLSNANIPNPVACVSSNSQSYTLTAIGVNGCVSQQTVFVGVNPTLSPTVTVPVINTCLGASVEMFQPVITPPGTYNFLWSPNNGTLSNIYIQNPLVATTKLGTSIYVLNVTDLATGCASNGVAMVNTFYCHVLDLPIRLKATPVGNAVQLQWLVPQQTNLDYYQLEYSKDGIHFSELTKVMRQTANNYSFDHSNPVEGFNYYRLKYVNLQGKYGLTAIQRIEIKADQAITLYPNPARTFCNLSVGSQFVNIAAELSVLAGDGRAVIRKSISRLGLTERIDLTAIPAGKYFVRLVTAYGVLNKELVVIR